jgi:hypothetical protein
MSRFAFLPLFLLVVASAEAATPDQKGTRYHIALEVTFGGETFSLNIPEGALATLANLKDDLAFGIVPRVVSEHLVQLEIVSVEGDKPVDWQRGKRLELLQAQVGFEVVTSAPGLPIAIRVERVAMLPYRGSETCAVTCGSLWASGQHVALPCGSCSAY